MRTIDKFTVFLAELIGTGLLLFIGCGGLLTWGGPGNHLQATLNFGLAVMIVIQIFGCVSGAHLNPAVTVAAYFYKHVDVQVGALYIVAQLLGGFMGFGLLKVLTPAAHFGQGDGATVGHCMTMPHPDVTVAQAVGVEFVATMVLILVCCGVWDPRNVHTHDSVGLRFGLAITALAITTGPYTGCSMNPARSFAPALWHGNMHQQWIYWLGPLAASIVTPLVYRAVFRREVITAEPAAVTEADEERLQNGQRKETHSNAV